MAELRQVRIFHFNTWADGLQDAAAWCTGGMIPGVPAHVAVPDDARLRQMARLDSAWHAENTRCLVALEHPAICFLPARVTGARGLAELFTLAQQRPANESWWLVFVGQMADRLGAAAGNVCAMWRKLGGRVLVYGFDEVSRTMACFTAIAPHLDVLIHDESPLAETGKGRLRSDCLTMHRSWVANVIPFAAPFNEQPEEKILFLGSQLGLTEHRKRQIEFLKRRFKDRFVASHDHSVSVADRFSLNRFKVGLCPEGRKFTTPAMSKTHTDRPFWSGCLGLVPVAEDSRQGGRLEELAHAGLIVRYAHGDLKALEAACEQALAAPLELRRRMYEHFNRHETVGPIMAEAIARVSGAG